MDQILQILIEQYEYDIMVMSQPWMYYWLMIPIILYVGFFFIKWTVLTAPLWLPFKVIIDSGKRRRKNERKK